MLAEDVFNKERLARCQKRTAGNSKTVEEN